MTPTINIDAKEIVSRFSPSGIPEGVRNNLRRVLPDLTRRLGASVEDKLNTQLKSRRRLKVEKTINEDPVKIVGRVRTVWTGSADKAFIPQILESGARAHPIYPRNAGALSFFWQRLGINVVLARVWHPGFPGIFYMQNSFREMEDEIIGTVTRAVTAGVAGKRVA